MRISLIKTKKQTSFKKRYATNKLFNSIIKNSSTTLITSRTCFRFEFIYFKVLKKWFKKLLSLKYKKTIQPKVWFNMYSNYPLTKKSKNSRMGKGKGAFLRWTVLLPINSILFAFTNVQKIRVRLILKKWNLTLSRKNHII